MARLAAVSMRCVRDRDENLEKYAHYLDQAIRREVDLVVFPEMSLQGYIMARHLSTAADRAEQYRHYETVAETIPGPFTHWLAQQCRGTNLVVQAGIAERDGAQMFNSTVLVDAGGVVSTFRKAHNRFEQPTFQEGGGLRTVETHVGRLGMLICYDVAFPEVPRTLALQGAELIGMSTAWPSAGDGSPCRYQRAYDVLTRSAAFCNHVFLVCANHVGKPGAKYWEYFGDSRIVAPTGEVIVSGGQTEGMIVADVDVQADIGEARTRWFFGLDLLEDRRPECYHALLGGA